MFSTSPTNLSLSPYTYISVGLVPLFWTAKVSLPAGKSVLAGLHESSVATTTVAPLAFSSDDEQATPVAARRMSTADNAFTRRRPLLRLIGLGQEHPDATVGRT